MKNQLQNILLIFGLIGSIFNAYSQGTWTQKASLTAFNGREDATAFAIGNYGYIGTGQTTSGFVDDFWKWDQSTNVWTPIANYAGAGRYGVTSFVINGNAYCCFGWSGTYNATDLWEYNPNTNVWTQKANFPGLGRYGSFVFVIGTKAYIGCGEPNSQPGYKDVWVYDAIANTWTQLANFPGGDRAGCIGFTLNGMGYAGCGGSNGVGYSDIWQYNPTLNTWTQVANYPIPGSQADAPIEFVIGCLAYVGTGLDIATYTPSNSFYSYDDVTNTWSPVASLTGAARWVAVGYAINGKGYVGTGCTVPAYVTDYWELGYIPKYLKVIQICVKVIQFILEIAQHYLIQPPGNGIFLEAALQLQHFKILPLAFLLPEPILCLLF